MFSSRKRVRRGTARRAVRRRVSAASSQRLSPLPPRRILVDALSGLLVRALARAFGVASQPALRIADAILRRIFRDTKTQATRKPPKPSVEARKCLREELDHAIEGKEIAVSPRFLLKQILRRASESVRPKNKSRLHSRPLKSQNEADLPGTCGSKTRQKRQWAILPRFSLCPTEYSSSPREPFRAIDVRR